MKAADATGVESFVYRRKIVNFSTIIYKRFYRIHDLRYLEFRLFAKVTLGQRS